MAKPAPSYAWALRFREGDSELASLSREGRLGVHCARQLALNARERSRAALLGELLPEKLTPTELGEDFDVGPARVHAWLRRARRELFGKELRERAIRYRLQQRDGRPARVCAEPGCQLPLPGYASAARRYCEEHRSGRARVARLRRARAASAS